MNLISSLRLHKIMTKYLYRIVSSPIHSEDWRLYISSDHPAGAQGSDSFPLNKLCDELNRSDWNFKYKLQQYPLTQEWTDC